MAGKAISAYGPRRCADIADEAAQNLRQRRRQERAGDVIAAHLRLIAKTAAAAASGTSTAHEPKTAIGATPNVQGAAEHDFVLAQRLLGDQ